MLEKHPEMLDSGHPNKLLAELDIDLRLSILVLIFSVVVEVNIQKTEKSRSDFLV